MQSDDLLTQGPGHVAGRVEASQICHGTDRSGIHILQVHQDRPNNIGGRAKREIIEEDATSVDCKHQIYLLALRKQCCLTRAHGLGCVLFVFRARLQWQL